MPDRLVKIQPKKLKFLMFVERRALKSKMAAIGEDEIERDPIMEDFETLRSDQNSPIVCDNLLPLDDNIGSKTVATRAVRVLCETPSPASSSPSNSLTASPKPKRAGRPRAARGRPRRGVVNGITPSTAKKVTKKSVAAKNSDTNEIKSKLRKPKQEDDVEDKSEESKHLVKELTKQLNLNGLEGTAMMSPKVMVKNCVVDLNSLEETKVEIETRLAQFEHIRENHFLCARRSNKHSKGMGIECDCSLTKAEKASKVIGCGDDCLNRMLMIECTNACSLGNLCGNKRFQKVQNAPSEVFKTQCKGLGLRATDDLTPETFIMEYVGEVLDFTKFRKRAKKYSHDDVQHFYFMALSSEHFIDASNRGNISRFINHSCNPNAETQKWTVNGELRIGFFAKRDIKKGEEITFDYKYERYGQEAQQCFCGSDNCRGWLGGDPEHKNEAIEASDDEEEEEGEEFYSSSSSEDEAEKPLPDQVATPTAKHKPTSTTALTPSKPETSSTSPSVTPTPPTPSVATKPKKIRKKRKVRRSPRKIKNFESHENEEKLENLKSSGIRTKEHTLYLVRIMLAVNGLKYKLIATKLLREADSPCRRLFIDYRGLCLLGNWVTELAWTPIELDLKLEILNALGGLPIPDKQVLHETKIWQTITRWSTASKENDPISVAISSEVSSRATSPTASSTVTPIKSETQPEPKAEQESSSKTADVSEKCEAEEPLPPGGEVMDFEQFTPTPPPENKQPDAGPVTVEKLEAVGEARPVAIARELSSQSVEQQQDRGLEKVDETTENEVTPVQKADVPVDEVDEEAKAELEDKTKAIQEKAKTVLESWQSLQEVKFKIPKALRILHEEEVTEASTLPSASETHADSNSKTLATNNKPWSYYETWKAPGSMSPPSNNITLTPGSGTMMSAALKNPAFVQRKRPRQSRFDDEAGVLHDPKIQRDALRHLFTKKMARQKAEEASRRLIFELHKHKCKYLCLKPEETPLFPQSPEYYYHHIQQQWFPLPPPPFPVPESQLPSYHPNNYPRMANMPVEAFREDDEPLPDPAKIYPPGVVPVSFFFGHPMSLDPQYAQDIQQQQREQELQERQPPQQNVADEQEGKEEKKPEFRVPVDPIIEAETAEEMRKIREAVDAAMPTTFIDPVTGEEMGIPEVMKPRRLSGSKQSSSTSSPTSSESSPTSPSSDDGVEDIVRRPSGNLLMTPIKNRKAAKDGTVKTKKRAILRPEEAPFFEVDSSGSGIPFRPEGPSVSERDSNRPELLTDDRRAVNQLAENDVPLPIQSEDVTSAGSLVPTISVAGGSGSGGGRGGKRPEIPVKLPPDWRAAKDAEGRVYYYHKKTRETQWEIPIEPNQILDSSDIIETSDNVFEVDTISTASEDNLDDLDENGDESDNEEEDDSDKEDEATNGNNGSLGNLNLAALIHQGGDLSQHEKELLLSKKTKTERRHERRQKREQNRERREYEKKRRRERHDEHRSSGLVQEKLIPRRTEKEKADMMTFDEIRQRIQNQTAIRERQEREERAEEERENEEASRQRREAELRRQQHQQQQHQAAQQQQVETVAADTSTEVARKIKEKFLKDASKVIVKNLSVYRKSEAAPNNPIKTVEDFKHLAKKLTNYIMQKELKHCTKIEDLKVNERVKKKTEEFVKKYMTKFTEGYKRSPQPPAQ